MKLYVALVVSGYAAMIALTHQPLGYGLLAVVGLLALGVKVRAAYRANKAG